MLFPKSSHVTFPYFMKIYHTVILGHGLHLLDAYVLGSRAPFDHKYTHLSLFILEIE